MTLIERLNELRSGARLIPTISGQTVGFEQYSLRISGEKLSEVCEAAEQLEAENASLRLERDMRRMAEQRNAKLLAEAKALREDAERLDWIAETLFAHQWNGVIGAGSNTHWRIAGDYRHTVAKMEGNFFRAAIDAARGQS